MMYDYSLMGQQKVYEERNQKYDLTIFGDCYRDIPHLDLTEINIHTIQNLNFDGGYVAFYENHILNFRLVFRGSTDNFSLFYVTKGEVIYFSDNFYALLPLIQEALLRKVSAAKVF